MKWNMQKENPWCKNALKLLNEISPGALEPSQSESTAAEYLKLCNPLLPSFFQIRFLKILYSPPSETYCQKYS